MSGWLRHVRARVVAEVGASEVLLTIGLACLARGLYLIYAPAAWIAIGVIIVWFALPPRPPLVVRDARTGRKESD